MSSTRVKLLPQDLDILRWLSRDPEIIISRSRDNSRYPDFLSRGPEIIILRSWHPISRSWDTISRSRDRISRSWDKNFEKKKLDVLIQPPYSSEFSQTLWQICRHGAYIGYYLMCPRLQKKIWHFEVFLHTISSCIFQKATSHKCLIRSGLNFMKTLVTLG